MLRSPCSCVVAIRMSLCVDVILKSSAYDIMFMLAGVGGSIVHVDVEQCGGQNRFWGSVGEISCVR